MVQTFFSNHKDKGTKNNYYQTQFITFDSKKSIMSSSALVSFMTLRKSLSFIRTVLEDLIFLVIFLTDGCSFVNCEFVNCELTHSFHLQENNSCTKKYFLLVQGGNA